MADAAASLDAAGAAEVGVRFLLEEREREPRGADGPAAPGSAPSASQALERLRLDVEEVFDRHRRLFGEPFTEPRLQALPGRASLLEPRLQVPGLPAAAKAPLPPEVQAAALGAVPPPLGGPPEVWVCPTPVAARGSKRSTLASRSSGGVATDELAERSSRRSQAAERTSTAAERTSTAAERLRQNSFKLESNGSDKNWMHTIMQENRPSRSRFVANKMKDKMGKAASKVWQRAKTTCIERLVRHPAYELARVMLILLDAAILVLEMQDAAQRCASGLHHGAAGIGDTLIFTVLLDISCACVVLDHFMRFTAGKPEEARHRAGASAGWQSFHALVAVTQLLQAIGHHSHRDQRSGSPTRVVLAMFSTLRFARVLSLVLVTNVIRQHRFFRELRIMVHALAGAVKVLLWSSLLIFMILLIFGTVLSEGTLAFMIRNELPAVDASGDAQSAQGASGDLEARFGSLFGSVLTLFQSMSGGLDWEQVWQSVGVLGWGYRAVYLLFICFSLFAMLNVVTAVFIESTMARSMSDRGLVVQNEVMEKKDFLTGMRTIFRELDVDADGELTNEELRRRMLEPEIGAFFSQLGMDVDQVGKLFFLLDRDKSGAIDPEEFMFGCLKFRGEAKSLDIAVMHQQVLWIHEALMVVVSHLGIADNRLSKQSVASSRLPSCSSKGTTGEVPAVFLPCGADGGSAKSGAGSWDLSSEFGISPVTSPARATRHPEAPVGTSPVTSPTRARRLPDLPEMAS